MKVYKSRFGWAIFIFMLVIFIMVSIIAYNEEQDTQTIVPMLLIFAGILLLFLILCLTTKYEIDNTHLRVYCPPFYNTKIEITSISSVAKTMNPISSPAPSIYRVEVHYKQGNMIIISPNDREEFMAHLKRINPAIEIKG